MTTTLTFNLPEEEVELKTCLDAGNWKALVWDFDQYLRSQLKYKPEYKENEYETLDEIRTKLNELLYEKGLSYGI